MLGLEVGSEQWWTGVLSLVTSMLCGVVIVGGWLYIHAWLMPLGQSPNNVKRGYRRRCRSSTVKIHAFRGP